MTPRVESKPRVRGRIEISTRVEKCLKMHGNSSVRFQKALRVLCRILIQKVDADGGKIGLFNSYSLDSNPPLVNRPQISTRLSWTHSLTEHLQTIKIAFLNCFACPKQRQEVYNFITLPVKHLRQPANVHILYTKTIHFNFSMAVGNRTFSTTLSFTISITIKRYSYWAWFSLLLGHTSVWSRLAAHTNILLSQTVIVMCAICAVHSDRYNVMISYRFSCIF